MTSIPTLSSSPTDSSADLPWWHPKKARKTKGSPQAAPPESADDDWWDEESLDDWDSSDELKHQAPTPPDKAKAEQKYPPSLEKNLKAELRDSPTDAEMPAEMASLLESEATVELLSSSPPQTMLERVVDYEQRLRAELRASLLQSSDDLPAEDWTKLAKSMEAKSSASLKTVAEDDVAEDDLADYEDDYEDEDDDEEFCYETIPTDIPDPSTLTDLPDPEYPDPEFDGEGLEEAQVGLASGFEEQSETEDEDEDDDSSWKTILPSLPQSELEDESQESLASESLASESLASESLANGPESLLDEQEVEVDFGEMESLPPIEAPSDAVEQENNEESSAVKPEPVDLLADEDLDSEDGASSDEVPAGFRDLVKVEHAEVPRKLGERSAELETLPQLTNFEASEYMLDAVEPELPGEDPPEDELEDEEPSAGALIQSVSRREVEPDEAMDPPVSLISSPALERSPERALEAGASALSARASGSAVQVLERPQTELEKQPLTFETPELTAPEHTTAPGSYASPRRSWWLEAFFYVSILFLAAMTFYLIVKS